MRQPAEPRADGWIVLCEPLQRIGIRSIVDLLLARLQRLDDRQLTLEVTDAARDWIADKGYDPVYGARPLERSLQRELETHRLHRVAHLGDRSEDHRRRGRGDALGRRGRRR